MNYIQPIWIIALRDFKSFFRSKIFFIVAGLCTALWTLAFYTGVASFVENTTRMMQMQSIAGSQSEPGLNLNDYVFKQHFAFVNLLMLFFVGPLTMRLLAEEKKTRTFDLLWTSPVTSFQIVLGKALAGAMILSVLLGISFLYPWSMTLFSPLEWGPLLSAYLGLMLLSLVYVCVGVFASSLTSSAVVAVVGALILNFGVWFLSIGSEYTDNETLLAIFKYLSIGGHLTDFMSGVIRLSSLVFLLSLALIWLIFTDGALNFSMTQSEARGIKKISKFSFVLSGVFALLFGIFRSAYSAGFETLEFTFLGLFFAFLLMGFFIERRLLVAFFLSRKTKKGMGQSVTVFLSLVLLIGLNYLVYKKDKSWDVTPDLVNTLSEQSLKVTKNLESVPHFLFLYKDTATKEQLEPKILPIVKLYQNVNPQIRFDSKSLIRHPELQKDFNLGQTPAGLFVLYGPQKERIYDVTEPGLTNALVKVSTDKKSIYFLVGHGERSIDVPLSDAQGISLLKKKLEDLFYIVKPLNLISSGEVPQDAAFLVIAGPQFPYQETELNLLRKYAEQGGHIFIAADPLLGHNMPLLTKSFGVEFLNTILFDSLGEQLRMGPTTVLGLVNDPGNPIMQTVPQDTPSYYLNASPLRRAVDLPKNWKVSELIKTQDGVEQKADFDGKKAVGSKGSQLLGIEVTGTMSPETKENEKSVPYFHVILFGDSDFMSNQFLQQPANNNLVMNSFLQLSRDEQVRGMLPKQASVTPLNMTQLQGVLYFVALLLIPLVCFAMGAFVWFRRKPV